jgi:hypothetical protein
MRVVVAEDPAGAVHGEDRRQCARRALRADDPDRHVAARSGDAQLLDVCGRLVHLAGLHLVDGLAALLGAEVEQVRRERRSPGPLIA